MRTDGVHYHPEGGQVDRLSSHSTRAMAADAALARFGEKGRVRACRCAMDVGDRRGVE